VIGLGPEIDDAIVARRLGRKGTIEPGPTVRVDLCVEAPANLEVISWSEFKGDEVARAGAQSLADVIPRNDEVAPVVGDATDDDVNVGIISVPMFSSDPVELCSKVPFRLTHQIPREGFQVGKLLRILRGHDKAEMMTIALTPLSERFVIGAMSLTVKHPTRSIVLRDSFAAQIFQMSSERRLLPSMPDDARLDSHISRPACHSVCGSEARAASATKGAAAHAMSRSMFESAGPLRGGQGLRNERFAAASTPLIANPTKPDAQVVVAPHKGSMCDVRAALMSFAFLECAPCRVAAHIVCDR
jgi:hypothetical protein